MPESFSKIYEASIGNTQFSPDDEHTLLTTNSSTSHVIKDVYVSTVDDETFNITDGSLELNGNTVATFNGNSAALTGHLIVPPNSTLKMKTTGYPVPVARTSGFWVDASGKVYWSHHYEHLTTGAYLTPTSTSSTGWLQEAERITNSSSVDNYQNITEVNWGYTNGYGNFLTYVTHDTNSQQNFRIYYANGSGNNGGVIRGENKNYSALGLHSKFDLRSTSLNEAMWRCGYSDNAVYKHDIDSNPGNPGVTNMTWSNWPTYNNNSPGTTSSYPRGHLFHNHLWWRPSSGYSNRFYSKDILTGQFYEWYLPQSVSIDSSLLDFVVSIDWDNDAMYIYKQSSANTVWQFKFDGLWSNYNNVSWTYNTRKDIPTSSWSYKSITLKSSLMQNGNMGGVQMGHRIDGGFTIFNSNYELDHYNGDGEYLFTQSTPKPLSSVGTPRWAWVSRQHKTTSSDLNSANIDAPDLKVTVVGITST